MSTHVICAEDHFRITDFLRDYRPFFQMEIDQVKILKKRLEMAHIVPEKELSRHVVSMYSTVRLVDLDDRTTGIYTLVYPYNANGGCGRISLLSPLGTALLGSRAGDVIECLDEKGRASYSIREVLYQPEWDERNRLAAARLASPR